MPSTCWFNNLRTRIPRAAWDKLRKKVYAQYHHRCALCQAESVRLNCHEIWQYDDTLSIQKLEGFIALCEMCHRCKHMGKAALLAREGKLDIEKVIDHFLRVNQCSRGEYEEHARQAWDTWKARSDHQWTTELGAYAHLVPQTIEGIH